jgi:hypothetical protein
VHDSRAGVALTSVARVKRANISAAALVAMLALGGCFGGDDDDATDTTTTPTSPVAGVSSPTTTTAPATTPPATTAPLTSTPELVTEGAIAVVANASRVNGAAGRMSERLQAAGFTVGDPTDSSEGPLETTKVYYNASVEGAESVAESIVAALGGGAIVAEPLPTPAPLEDPEAIGDATVLVALGNDAADKTLEQLQGLEPLETTPDTEPSDTTTPPTTAAG